MNDFPQDGDDEGLVPLFTLSPQQVGPRTRSMGTAPEAPHAVFQRDRTFGYDCRLDEDYRPDTGFGSEWGDTPEYSPRPERSRRSIGLLIALAFLGTAGALVATQPSARAAVGSVAGRFFGGSSQAPVTAPTATPTGDVLALGGDASPTPASDPTADPSASAIPTDNPNVDSGVPTDTPAPTTVPAPTATPAPPIFVTGTYGTKTSTCQSGKPSGATCAWQVNIAGGNPLYADVQWQSGANIQLTVVDAAGNPLFSEASSSGIIQASVAAPPATVYVKITVTSGTNVTYTVGLAAHSF